MNLSKNEAELLENAYKTMPNNHTKYHPETEAAIVSFENKHGAIPSEYRYLLMNYGACHFADPWICTLKELTVEVMRPFEHGNIASINNTFPIGGLGDGSIVCILKKTGQVAILPHDVYVETIEDLEVIANSFKDLILTLANEWLELEFHKLKL
jgi:hypothetical protein